MGMEGSDGWVRVNMGGKVLGQAGNRDALSPHAALQRCWPSAGTWIWGCGS